MISDLNDLLRNIVKGDEPAWQILRKYFEDNLLSNNELEQVHLYIKHMSKENLHAIYVHALLYDHGMGVKQDYEMAFILMRTAAVKGHVAAMYETGRRYLYAIGIAKNTNNAEQWLSLAASSPHYYAQAMHLLGLMYQEGLGVDKDPVKAKEWLEKAIQKG
ncbi:MAG: tetratricopeptide repeat protein [Gammaproteobacteria bacterium]